jgi:hypothetical protein
MSVTPAMLANGADGIRSLSDLPALLNDPADRRSRWKYNSGQRRVPC